MEKSIKKINYSKSIKNLFDDIKEILINEVKAENSEYEYISLNGLKENAILYLPTKSQSCAIALYNLVMNPKDEAYEYRMLLNIYNNLK